MSRLRQISVYHGKSTLAVNKVIKYEILSLAPLHFTIQTARIKIPISLVSKESFNARSKFVQLSWLNIVISFVRS